MNNRFAGALSTLLALGAIQLGAEPAAAQAQQQPMSFFITSVGPGDGGNLGGVEGADRHCQTLAQAAGRGQVTWRAYLSSSPAGGQPGQNARDRIGTGPWYNANGVLIAANVADLHGDIHRDRNNINKEFALNERGEMVGGRGDQPNEHDILTGSDSHGRSLAGIPAATATCNNWTSNAAGQAMVGHHDRAGGGNSSWNSVHLSRGCSQADFVATGGAGLYYCFAT
jgi:hypothetical protein